jgi:hypothetical protein
MYQVVNRLSTAGDLRACALAGGWRSELNSLPCPAPRKHALASLHLLPPHPQAVADGEKDPLNYARIVQQRSLSHSAYPLLMESKAGPELLFIVRLYRKSAPCFSGRALGAVVGEWSEFSSYRPPVESRTLSFFPARAGGLGGLFRGRLHLGAADKPRRGIDDEVLAGSEPRRDLHPRAVVSGAIRIDCDVMPL